MTPLSGRFYRIVFADNLASVLDPVQNPEGRFHHGGQPALYTSATPQGARLALGYYARSDDPPRQIIELNVTNGNLFDLRDENACETLSIQRSDATVRWQKQRAAGQSASPWRVSDAVRVSGADGMIYPSSTRAGIFHMVLFRWNSLGGAVVRTIGSPRPCELD